MRTLNLTDNPYTSEISRFLEQAKDDFELKAFIGEVREQGKRILGDSFDIFFDGPITLENFRNRVFIRGAWS
ncbi:hypothetical protein Z948_3568 [Sulfitobacter donghicola DSW-25 = KCTC 12864 = JCM 14565]|uniref:Uncharacterized protein n=2 Tax=Sulfitobacter TaxID=60136 RepID=A0A073IDV3_9RHOB|nr:hypothetical protein [Sulfitobacter donghicola]KEJ87760.1 hypothetical protein DSW25_05185 [Sulfitobacter donghicola DSW-25 = KCTC 12864 = JCM 14565]KIN61833.1 hypothetical protein Z948_3568 [Sulfitobacter donghicola DSW-25 = KCTC 12864 = JCM 14565]